MVTGKSCEHRHNRPHCVIALRLCPQSGQTEKGRIALLCLREELCDMRYALSAQSTGAQSFLKRVPIQKQTC